MGRMWRWLFDSRSNVIVCRLDDDSDCELAFPHEFAKQIAAISDRQNLARGIDDMDQSESWEKQIRDYERRKLRRRVKWFLMAATVAVGAAAIVWLATR